MANLTANDIKTINGTPTIIATDDTDTIDVSESTTGVTIQALAGDDEMIIANGNHNIDGGDGNDSVTFYYDYSSTELPFNPFQLSAYSNSNGTISFQTKLGQYRFTNIETIFYHKISVGGGVAFPEQVEISIEYLDAINQQTDQTINGTADNDSLYGGFANDTINGLEGDDTIEGYDGNDTINGGNGNDQLYGGSGNDIIYGGAGNDSINGNVGNDSINAGSGDDLIDGAAGDTIDGGDGNDTVKIYGRPYLVDKYKNENGEISFAPLIGSSKIALKNIENIEFFISAGDWGLYDTFTIAELDALYGINGHDITGTSNNDIINGQSGIELIYGLAGNDWIKGLDHRETIYAGDGDDIIINSNGNDYIDGGDGEDTFHVLIDYDFYPTDLTALNEILNISKLKKGGYLVSTESNHSTLQNIENIGTIDIHTQSNSFTLESLLANKEAPIASINRDNIPLSRYTGTVEFLEFQFIGHQEDDIAIGSTSNDFFNLGEGDDAVDGGIGDDVLDGGAGSNFLTGGEGSDTFFLDGRNSDITWSTITDFNGDEVNIWGWNEGMSKLLSSEDNAGAEGFKGATLHYDLNNDGTIDTSITFGGLALSEIPQSLASVIEETGYLLFAQSVAYSLKAMHH